jgi:hypothetical protein
MQPTLVAHPTPRGILDITLKPAEEHVEYTVRVNPPRYTSDPMKPGKFTRVASPRVWWAVAPNDVVHDLTGIQVLLHKDDSAVQIKRVRLAGMDTSEYFGDSVWMVKPVGPSFTV